MNCPDDSIAEKARRSQPRPEQPEACPGQRQTKRLRSLVVPVGRLRPVEVKDVDGGARRTKPAKLEIRIGNEIETLVREMFVKEPLIWILSDHRWEGGDSSADGLRRRMRRCDPRARCGRRRCHRSDGNDGESRFQWSDCQIPLAVWLGGSRKAGSMSRWPRHPAAIRSRCDRQWHRRRGRPARSDRAVAARARGTPHDRSRENKPPGGGGADPLDSCGQVSSREHLSEARRHESNRGSGCLFPRPGFLRAC